MRNTIRRLSCAVVMALPFLATPALAEQKGPVFAQTNKIALLHPLQVPAGGRETRAVKRQIFDALVVQGDDLQAQPQLAKSWVVEDELRWVFTLREGVTFHNGEPFNAEVVKYNFDRLLAEDATASFSSQYKTLLDSVEVTGEYEITLVTKKPAPTLLTVLAFTEIVPKALIEEIGDDAFAEAPVGTGPFTFVSREGSTVVLARNEGYWGGAPAAEGVTFVTIPEVASRIAALKVGEVHAADQIPPDQLAGLTGDVAPMTASGTRIYFVAMNVNEPPFDQVEVRRAVAAAIDRALIAEALYGGMARPLNQPAFPEMLGYQADIKGFSYDPEAAKAVLSTVTTPVKISVRQNDLTLAQAAAGFLTEAGLNVEVVLVEDAAFSDAIDAGTPQAYVSSWGVAEGVLDAIVSRHFYTDRSQSSRFTNYSNPKLDALYLAASSTTDADARAKAHAEIIDILIQDAPWATLVNPTDIYGISTQLEGWSPSPTGLYRLNTAKLAD